MTRKIDKMPDTVGFRRVQRVAIVAVPCMHPTIPPLGPAALLAYLKRHAPWTKVRCYDINLEYYYKALRLLEKGTLKLRLYNWEPDETAEKIHSAFEFLKSTPPNPLNIKEFHRQATYFLSFENILNSFMSEMARRFLAKISVPERITLFFQELVDDIIRFQPDLVAISTLFDIQMPFSLLVARLLREKTNARIVLGGARFGVSPCPGRILAKPLLINYQGTNHRVYARGLVDAVVSGEGEMALLHLVRAETKKDFFAAPDLCFWKNGRIIQNPPLVIHDLDSVPFPDFSDMKVENYMCPEVILPFLTARGCPWGRCAFCTHHHSYKRYRQISIERVIEGLNFLKAHYGASFFNLYDEMVPPARLKNIARLIRQNGLSIYYSAYAKPVKSFDKHALEGIYASGCRVMLWGVESASQRVLDLMNKGSSIKEVERILLAAHQAGIKNLVFIMFGFPGETKEEFFQTIHFLRKHVSAIHALSKGRFRLVEGSKMLRKPRAYGIHGIRSIAEDPMMGKEYTYKTEHGLSRKETQTLYEQNLPILEKIGITPRFGTYREHLLVYAAYGG